MSLYAETQEFVKKKLPLDNGVKVNEYTKKFARDYVLDTLPKEVDKEKIYNDKVDRKVVIIDFSNKKEKRLPEKRLPEKPKKQSKRLSSRLRKKLGIYTIPKENHRYSVFEPLHTLWKEYIGRVIGTSTGSVASQRIVKAEFHGAFVSVIRSKCYSFVGKEGIVIQETKNTFTIISKDNKLLTIPKTNTLFEIRVSNLSFTFFGNQIMYRASERATKKFKPKSSLGL
ncbi:hypothetical protein BB560_000462 [Smittium megazygosporum]|uniref:Ribonuclease P protein subunit n=1 Tax=Smittium megazygosporum TaxID=133381 RepID=A0A2T9ZKE5_9FUNG|nr:hypothetical protein BB560_000462 [Smittium megazygosporum]